MKGLELSRAFWEQCGKPMLEERFPHLLPYLAVGLLGSGSECFGYDDGISQDHDFEPGFCLFLPGEELLSRRDEFLLERAYAGLPKTFLGFRRSPILPVGGARHGVLRTEDFFLRKVGAGDGALTTEQWLSVPEQALAEATNGELFFDGYGEVTRIRDALRFFPEDVRLKRLAGHLLMMAQSGMYNYPRCLRHGEAGAARLAAVEYVRSAMSAVFLLNRHYQPFYKWAFRALRELPVLPELAVDLGKILTEPDEPAEAAREKSALIEAVTAAVAAEVRRQGTAAQEEDDPERLAYAVNDGISDAWLRNLHILAAV